MSPRFNPWDAYIAQDFRLCDLWLHGEADREEIIEAFVGCVWSGQIRRDKRLVS